MAYRLTRPSLRDLTEIVTYVVRETSPEIAEQVEARLFAAFNDLVRLPQVGHRRLDVRRKDLLFHVVHPHLIAFRREPDGTVMVIRVLHGKRNVRRILR